MTKFNKKLYKYIKKNIDDGFDKQVIISKLIDNGYDKTVIEEIIKDIEEIKTHRFFGLFKVKKKEDIKSFDEKIPDIQYEEEEKVEPIKETPNPEYHSNIIAVNDKKGLSQKVDDINEKLDMMTKPIIEKKNKNFNLPWKITRQLKKIADKNKVLVILLRTNKKVEPIITDIKEGFISINGVPHNCSMDFIYLWKGKFPCIILNEWDLNPIGTQDYYEAVAQQRTAEPVAVVLRMIKTGEALMKNKVEFNKTWIFIGLAIIVILYLIFSKGAGVQ